MEKNGWRLYADADLSSLQALWQRAYSEHIFQQYELNAAWARIFGESRPRNSKGYQIRIWIHESPPMILPWAQRDGNLHWLGHGLMDYADPLGPPGELAEAILPEEAGVWNLRGIRAHSPWQPVFQRLARATRSEFKYLSSAPFCGEMTAAELENKHGRVAGRWHDLERQGVGCEAVREVTERQQLLRQMLQWKQQRMGEDNILRELEAAWLDEAAAHEFCELWRLGNDAAWAGFLTWRQGHTRYGYLLAHDPARARASPGIMLLYAVLRRTLAEGMRFDFLTGEQGFKMRFATGREELFCLRGSARVDFQR